MPLDLAQLIPLLTDPAAYPHAVPDPVVVHQTHISAVFLAGPYAYKLKKPLDLGFLDFTTLDKRRRVCVDEVRLNRRLAPETYLGVVPVTLNAGRLRIDGDGQVVEWAVWMQRLPEEQTLAKRLERGEVDFDLLQRIGRRLARFHAAADGGPEVSAFGRWGVVARNARENLEQTVAHRGVTVSDAVHDRLVGLVEDALARHRLLIDARAGRGVTRDTHGDLHLDHVYVFPERAVPDDLVIVDCIEFNERFRYADPIADIAFLAMDLTFAGRRDLSAALVDAYLTAADDEEGRALLPFYTSYRAAVRAKVDGFEVFESEVPEEERNRALVRSRAHWLLALAELEEPPRRPCLVLFGGLPGTGKSSVAREIAATGGFELISSDRVRKELAGLAPGQSAAAAFGEGIYTREWTERTYAECLARAEKLLFQGSRVAVDANFPLDTQRRAFLDAARRWSVPSVLILREAAPEAVRERLARRQGSDSDADWSVYQKAADRWEDLGDQSRAAARLITAFPTREGAVAAARRILEAEALL